MPNLIDKFYMVSNLTNEFIYCRLKQINGYDAVLQSFARF